MTPSGNSLEFSLEIFPNYVYCVCFTTLLLHWMCHFPLQSKHNILICECEMAFKKKKSCPKEMPIYILPYHINIINIILITCYLCKIQIK